MFMMGRSVASIERKCHLYITTTSREWRIFGSKAAGPLYCRDVMAATTEMVPVDMFKLETLKIEQL